MKIVIFKYNVHVLYLNITTSYDFSDLHIIGEFDNRPGTGRFFRIFSCVVTYRTGAGRRLYMIPSDDARLVLLEISRTL